MIRVASSCFGAYEDDWEKLPQSTLKSVVEISSDGKLVITPVAGIDKLFLKVARSTPSTSTSHFDFSPAGPSRDRRRWRGAAKSK